MWKIFTRVYWTGPHPPKKNHTVMLRDKLLELPIFKETIQNNSKEEEFERTTPPIDDGCTTPPIEDGCTAPPIEDGCTTPPIEEDDGALYDETLPIDNALDIKRYNTVQHEDTLYYKLLHQQAIVIQNNISK